MNIKKTSHAHFQIMIHMVLVTKYRKSFPIEIWTYIKEFSYEYLKDTVEIIRIETNRNKSNHIYYLIQVNTLNINLKSSIIRLKQYITYKLYKSDWKRHKFFSQDIFISSVGNVSEEIIKNYIEKQG